MRSITRFHGRGCHPREPSILHSEDFIAGHLIATAPTAMLAPEMQDSTYFPPKVQQAAGSQGQE
jgi:hypothetical protein